jgi:GGDEF domain-containing protein
LEKNARDAGVDYPMSFSYGIEEIDTEDTLLAEEYIDIADRKMYIHKQRRKSLT